MSSLETAPLLAERRVRPPSSAWARSWWPVPVATALGVLVPVFATSFDEYLVGLILLFAIATQGLSILTGYGGQISLAQSAMFGLGAYVSGVLTERGLMTFPYDLILALLAGAAVSVVAGIAVRRMSELSFAIASFGLTIIFQRLVVDWRSVTGGFNGLYVPSSNIFGSSLQGGTSGYILIVVLFLVATLGCKRVGNGIFGRSLQAMSASSVAAEGMGHSSARLRLMSFTWAGSLAAVAGALYGTWSGYLSADQFDASLAILFLSAVVLGGLRSMLGVAVATAVLEGVPQAFSGAGQWTQVGNGVLLAVATLIVGARAPSVRKLMRRVGASIGWRRVSGTGVGLDVSPSEADGTLDWLVVEDSTGIEVRGVSLSFGGIHALRDLSLSASAGEVLGLVGPNGAGKSSLLNVITGVYRPDTGSVMLDGAEVQGRSVTAIARSGVRRTYQTPQLFPTLSVRDHVYLAHPEIRRRSLAIDILAADVPIRRERRAGAEVDSLIALLGLDAVADVAVTALAPGSQQILQLARALAGKPRVLLLDEITAGLDLPQALEVGELVRRVARSYRVTVILISHDMPVVMSACDRIVVMSSGTVLADGTPADIRANPEVIAAYLGVSAHD